MSIARYQATARAVSYDKDIRVRVGIDGSGFAASYDPLTHVITLAPSTLSLPIAEGLAITAHEAGHELISKWFWRVSPMGPALELTIANILDDGRLNSFLGANWDGLEQPMRALDEQAVASAFTGKPLPPAWEFVWALRAELSRLPVPRTTSDDVRAALDLARSHLDPLRALPPTSVGQPDAGLVVAASDRFYQAVHEHIVPLFMLLDGHDDSETRVERWRSDARRTRASVIERDRRRSARYLERLAKPDPRHLPTPDAGRRASIAAMLQSILEPNERDTWRAGYPIGRRVDPKLLMRAAHDPKAAGRMWMRREIADARRYAIIAVADLSSSMEGEPVQILADVVFALSLAARQVGLDSAVVAFGHDAAHDDRASRVAYLLRHDEPTSAAFARWARLMEQGLGDESPLHLGLAAAGAIVRELDPEVRPLVVALCDGAPNETAWAHVASAIDAGSVDDSGTTGPKRSLSPGWYRLWRPSPIVAEEVRRQVVVLEAAGAVVLGIGVGAGAKPISELFRHSASAADADELVRRLGPILVDALGLLAE